MLRVLSHTCANHSKVSRARSRGFSAPLRCAARLEMRQTTPPPILGFFRSVLALPVLSFYTNGQAALSLSARALAGIRGDSERSRAAPAGDLGTSVLPGPGTWRACLPPRLDLCLSAAASRFRTVSVEFHRSIAFIWATANDPAFNFSVCMLVAGSREHGPCFACICLVRRGLAELT